MVRLDLCRNSKRNFYYYPCFLRSNMRDLDCFLEKHDDMNCLDFAKRVMMGREIQSNNSIEGIDDDLEVIDHVIGEVFGNISLEEKRRILNLYYGYEYIFENKVIDDVHLKELYDILSYDLLDEFSMNHMGKYYRDGEVYIVGKNQFDVSRGVNSSLVDEYMERFFDYVHSSNVDSDIDVFLKSQIMHFYFVYVHPYFDVNGRTARTVSLWYLLNHCDYSFVVFNRSISYYREKYLDIVRKSAKSGNVTYFLKYMLVCVRRELEKENLVHHISLSSGYNFNSEEEQLIELLLMRCGEMTFKEMMDIYCMYHLDSSFERIYHERVESLVHRGILVISGNDMKDMVVSLNRKYVDMSCDDYKYLKLKK